jgi:uncharacterized membrane protein
MSCHLNQFMQSTAGIAHTAILRSRRMHTRTPTVSLRFRYYLLILLPAAGCAVATYLALYQVGIVATVWEPLFGDGSRLILDSSFARSLPFPDAALGAAGYFAELLCATVRWRESATEARSAWRVWLQRAYYALVAAFTVGSVLLVALQWGYFHAWCTLCLTSALLSFVIAGVVTGEFRARRG